MHDSLIPRPDTLQVGWGWFQILLTLTFTIHVLLMNAMVGGAVVTLLGGLRRSGPPLLAARDIAGRVPTLIALAVNAGVAPLLFMQVLYGHLFYSSSIVMASWWFSLIPLLIIGYYAAYGTALKFDRPIRRPLTVVTLLILLFIAFLWVNNNTMTLDPSRWAAWFTAPGGVTLNLGEPTLWPRYLHMIFGAIAVGALFVALIQDNRAREGDTEAAEARDWAMRLFTHGTLAVMAVGIWWLMVLREDVMKLFMGGSIAASVALLLGIATGVYALICGFLRKMRLTVALTVVTVLVMVIVREFVRTGMLAGQYHPSELEVVPAISPLILFLGVFAVGIVCVVYMLKLAARAGQEG